MQINLIAIELVVFWTLGRLDGKEQACTLLVYKLQPDIWTINQLSRLFKKVKLTTKCIMLQQYYMVKCGQWCFVWQ